MPEILITIAKDGTPTVEVQGVAGPGCRDLSMAIENALGAPQSCELTSEYYQAARSAAQDQALEAGQR